MSRKKDAAKHAAEEQAEPAAENVAENVAEPAPEDALVAVTAERDDLLSRLQRLGADYQNYQKRVRRDINEDRQFAVTELVKALLDVLDDLERAVGHARVNHDDDDPLLVGTDLVYKKALGVLKGFGVEPIEAEGKMFDPARHEAMMQQPTDDAEPMTVLSQAQRGYLLNGRTIRPAKVVVAMTPAAAEEEACDSPQTQEGHNDADI